MREPELVFIHLSDIHFHPDSHGGFGAIDRDIRVQLLKDAEKCSQGKSIKAILVTGDIAFSAAAEQYQIAEQWLTKLCQSVGCELENLWTVPGNHDVNRQIARQNKTLGDRQQELRGLGWDTVACERRFDEYLADADFRNFFFEPLAAYNDFAKRYGLEMGPDRMYWEKKLSLDDYTLYIRGMNTVLISNEHDNNLENKLFLGRHQALCEEADIDKKVIYLTMAHHPPGWLIDENDDINNYLNARASIQLFGHKHRQTIEQAHDHIRLIAGATNPEEDQRGWRPCYNIISIAISRESGTWLRVSVEPRVWHEQRKSFAPEAQPDEKTYVEWFRQLEPAPPRARSRAKSLFVVLGSLILIALAVILINHFAKSGIPQQVNHEITEELPVAFGEADIALEHEIPRLRAHQRFSLSWDRFPTEDSPTKFRLILTVQDPNMIAALAMKRDLEGALNTLQIDQSPDNKSVVIHMPVCNANEAVFLSVYVYSTDPQFDKQTAIENINWAVAKEER
jgi:hypothetical protein